jgi:hypothetical protein
LPSATATPVHASRSNQAWEILAPSRGTADFEEAFPRRGDHNKIAMERIFAGMKTVFANDIYVVSATKDGQTEFWAAATARRVAAAQVQQLLPPGWKAALTGWRLNPERAAKLKMLANTVRPLQ